MPVSTPRRISGLISSPSVSCDGRLIAYQRRRGATQQIYVCDGTRARTVFEDSGLTFCEWLPGAHSLIVGHDPSRIGRERLLHVDLTGAKSVLLEASADQRRFGGVTRDGRLMAFGAVAPGSMKMRLEVVDLVLRRVREVPVAIDAAMPRSWHPDGRHLLLSVPRSESASRLYLCDSVTGSTTALFDPAEPAVCRNAVWSEDGRHLYMVTDAGRDFAGIARLCTSSGALEYLATPSCDVEAMAMSGDGQYLSWVQCRQGMSELKAVTTSNWRQLPRPAVGPGSVSVMWSRSAPVAAILSHSVRRPSQLIRWAPGEARASRRARTVAVSRTSTATLRECRRVTMRSEDGERVFAWLYRPTTTVRGVVVHLHGGPTAQARPACSARFRSLLKDGYAILDIDYRGSSGYGKRFAQLNDGLRREDELLDVGAAVAWVHRRWPARPVALCGHSYGGYLALASMAALPGRVAAAVSLSGVTDWISALTGVTSVLAASDLGEYGDLRHPKVAAMLKRVSPVTNASRISGPVLLVHGGQDRVVPISHCDEMARRLKAAGGEVRVLRLESAGHHYTDVEEHAVNRALRTFLRHALSEVKREQS